MRIEVTRRKSAEPDWVSEVWDMVYKKCINATGAVEDEDGRLRTHHAYVDAFLGHSEVSCQITLRAENNNRVIGHFRFDRNALKDRWDFYDNFNNRLKLI